MKGLSSGTLMRYFLFVFLPVAFLSSGINDVTCQGGLIFFSGAFKRFGSCLIATVAGTITLTTITVGTDNDLSMTTTTTIKTTWSRHRQKSRWGLDLYPKCVTMYGSCICTVFMGYGVNFDRQICDGVIPFSTTLHFIACERMLVCLSIIRAW